MVKVSLNIADPTTGHLRVLTPEIQESSVDGLLAKALAGAAEARGHLRIVLVVPRKGAEAHNIGRWATPQVADALVAEIGGIPATAR